ncbi:MAG: ABC transporter ATP-binding protein [Candidatus Alectryocaccobium sp.]|jgi:ATP-binding cassette subfamily B multidrug efflux pump|nr:ABC transporter ATP-binding protein/permease [Lachnospiraceae bacterium]MDY6221930.1 ABC transporter ATP-binding protein [Candidatus Alectryocaccobium sp.]
MPGPFHRQVMSSNEKTDLKSLKKLAAYIKKYIPIMAIALVCAIAGAMASIIGPEKISDLMDLIIDGIMTGIDLDAVAKVAFTLVAIYLTGAALTYAQQFIMATVTQKTTRRLRTDIDNKLNRLPLRFFDRTSKGDILSRVTNDADTISQTLSTSLANLVSSLALFAGVIFKMFTTNVILALVTIGSSLVGFALMVVILKKSQKYFNRKQSDLGRMNGQIEEVYTNHNIVHAFGGKKKERKIFNETNEKLYDSNWRSQWLSGMMMPIMAFSGNLAYALVFIVGVAIIIGGSGAVTLGTIVAFVIYAKMFSQPLSTIAQAMTSFQQASAASKRIFELLSEEEMPDESGKTNRIEAVKGDVEFEHVRFGYDPKKTIIHDFSASVKAGQKVAIVGPTGAGKTTMVNLLMRFYDPDSGDILIDGVSVGSMKREEVHDLFDMILQDTWLFEGTIRENLVYNKKNVTDAELDRACKAVGLKHFIETLSKGYDTMISDNLNLSEGQKQQLTIARAMIKDAPLLILDEATSSVDTRTEIVIQEAMDRLTKGRTSFVIAHRLSTIRNADIILVMRDGDIIEQGNHEELLGQNGFYAELYNSQFVVA